MQICLMFLIAQTLLLKNSFSSFSFTEVCDGYRNSEFPTAPMHHALKVALLYLERELHCSKI